MKTVSKFKKISSKVNFVELEHKILNFWEKKRTFQKCKEKNNGGPKWSFIDGPITANNPMGVHHAWGRSLKDLFQRYHAMKGHELRYQNGFDCQGLWVEVEVEKELGFKTKRQVEEFGIEKFVQLCKDRVIKYSGIQTEQSKRLGYWMDWENSYFTMSEDNNYTIWSFLKKLFNEGKIYKGADVVPWSGRSGTSYSQMEIIEGRKLVSHRAIFVKFPLKNKKNENLLVWTTTPWTLTANTMAAVNIDLNYIKLKVSDGSIYYFAEDNLKFQRLEKQFKEKKNWIKGVPKLKTLEQIFKERGGYEIIDTIKGSEMVGWEYSGPFDHFEVQNIKGGYPFSNSKINKTSLDCHQVIDPGKDNIGNDIVVSGEGTGIVHMAPGCGDIDHRVGKKLNMVNIAPLNDESCFTDKFDWLNGKSATNEETIDEIITDLKKRNLLVYVEEYPHVYPHCWRSGDELVFRMVDEWYINMDWRQKIIDTVDQIKWIPEWGREREHEWLNNMGDWMISKKRFWGLALPIWEFEDGSFFVVGSREELEELAVEGWDEFKDKSPHRPYIDKIKIKHPDTGLIGTRVLDVGNPWLDAGIVPFSTLQYNKNKNYWNDWFPADFVVECFPGQFRNWFYSLLAMSAMMEGKAPFKTLLGHALVRDETGREMHKSWGNAIWFEDAAEKMGADVMRWIYASQKTEHNLNFGYTVADEERKHLITLWNTYSFFITYARLDGFNPGKVKVKNSERSKLDRWILAKVNLLAKSSQVYIESYEVFKLMKDIRIFIDELSNWYVRRNRRRFWKSENDNDKIAAYDTLYLVLEKTIRILAPIIPFTTDAIYQNLVSEAVEDAPESVHLTDYPLFDDNIHDQDLLNEMDILLQVVSLGRSARNRANIKNRQPIAEFRLFCDDETKDLLIRNENQILEELNVKKVSFIKNRNDLIKYQLKPNFKNLGHKFGSNMRQIVEIINQNQDAFLKDAINRKAINLTKYGFENSILEVNDFILDEKGVGDFEVASGNNFIVGVNTIISDDLKNEGLVRDLVRHVQSLRKDSDFNVEDRIEFYIDAEKEIINALLANEDYFLNEVLGIKVNICSIKNLEYNSKISLDGKNVQIAISQYGGV